MTDVLTLVGIALVVLVGVAALELFVVAQERRVTFCSSLAALGRGVARAAQEQGLGRRSIDGGVR